MNLSLKATEFTTKTLNKQSIRWQLDLGLKLSNLVGYSVFHSK